MSDATGIMPGIHPTAIVSPRAELGDNVTIVAAKGAITPMGTLPRTKTYRVAAVFEIGM